MNTDCIIGTHIAIPWSSLVPFHYGTYKGKLKNRNSCTIDVDWKQCVVDDVTGTIVGTDQIDYWLCDINHVIELANQLNGTN